MRTDQHLLVVSNRLPAAIVQDDSGEWQVSPSAGGLVTAMAPIMSRNGGTWIGWPGCSHEAPAAELLKAHSEDLHFELKPVSLTDEEVAGFYRGFSNSTIWPLFHDLLGYCSFDAGQWQSYCEVNRRFAGVVSSSLRDNCFVWIHDYQLLLVGHFLRDMGVSEHLSFFLHIPFPSADLFKRLPWRREILKALLSYDHIGFQTNLDFRNFIRCVRSFVPEAKVRTKGNRSVIRLDGRLIALGYYPISIDFSEFDRDARSKEVQDASWYISENHRSPKLMLGLDRLDYTKGIPERFLALERALEKYPDLVGQISLVQVVVPSRVTVPDYQELKEELDQLAGRINGQFSRHGWMPLYYMFRHLDRVQLLGYYRAADIALLTPLRDGMNLVCKEFCAASVEDNGVLVLSEFTGAAAQMAKGAIIVNPYDLEGTADAIYAATIMDDQEKKRRMRLLRSEVRRNDVGKWLEWFLNPEIAAPPESLR